MTNIGLHRPRKVPFSLGRQPTSQTTNLDTIGEDMLCNGCGGWCWGKRAVKPIKIFSFVKPKENKNPFQSALPSYRPHVSLWVRASICLHVYQWPANFISFYFFILFSFYIWFLVPLAITLCMLRNLHLPHSHSQDSHYWQTKVQSDVMKCKISKNKF